jgi:hypothetical protein
MSFDVKRFLEDKNIRYIESGTNTTKGWVEIHCPFRNCSDPSFHMGWCYTGKYQGAYHCWICGKRAPVATPLVQSIMRCSFSAAESIVAQYDDGLFSSVEERPATTLIKPIGLIEELPIQHRKYLMNRGYDPDFLSKKYGILAGHVSGDFPYRVVAPVYQENEIVNYQGRDISGQQIKYMSWKNEKAAIPIRDCVYNIDNVKQKTAVVVEGIFDVWRIGDGAIGTFGTEFTLRQAHSIVLKELDCLIVLYDKDAKTKAEKFAHFMSPFIPSVEVITIQDKKDPGELSEKEALQLRKNIFG